MSERPVVLVDMDGVLADFDGATNTYLQRPEVNIPLQPRQNFYFREDYLNPSHVDVINKLHTSKNFFRDLPPVKDAIEGWARLLELGYNPRICSSPLRMNEWCKDEKLDWIRQHFGEKAAANAIIDSRKELYTGIALIADQASWQYIVFDATYNQQSPAELRLNGWKDPSLPELLASCLEKSTNSL